MFGNLSDRLIETFKNLRSKGKLSPADIDATLREIRRALLEADVALEVVKNFTTHFELINQFHPLNIEVIFFGE